jgi:hypothetical protein
MNNEVTVNIDHSKTWFTYQVRIKHDDGMTPVGNVFLKNNKLVYEKNLKKTQFLPSSMMNIVAKKAREDGYVVVVTDVKLSK